MNGLVEIIKNQNKRNCDLCAVSLFLNVIQFGLILCLHGGDV